MSKYILIDSEIYDENQDYFDLQQENQQLKERNKEIYDGFMVAIDEVCETDREKRKYKSILTELEEWLKQEIKNIKTNYSQVNGNYFNMNYKIETYEDTLDKIQKLKEKYK